MKKFLIRILMSAALLFVLNWIYTQWFFKKDMAEHSKILELVYKVIDDNCRIVYLGESSNITCGYDEPSKRSISAYIGDYFPNVKTGDITHAASHAQIYYYMLKNIPRRSTVETVIVTMNLRSFSARWIYSDLETPLQKQLVLMKDYPPLMNRFLLALKVYPIWSEEEMDSLTWQHWREDTLVFPYEFEWNNVYLWDSAVSWQGRDNYEGQYDQKLTELACHYIKNYGFQIKDDNPRVKDFDDIVALCRKRGWHLVFNLMAEDVDKANSLVGKELMYLMKQNHDYLLDRYGHLEGVTLVDNFNLVRDVNFRDQDWTTEHYYEEGRRIIAKNVAEALKAFYPGEYHDPESLKYDVGHYYFGDQECQLDTTMPYGPTVVLPVEDLREDWERVNVAFMLRQADVLHKAKLAVQLDVDTTVYYDVKPQIQKIGCWDFATYDLPVDSTIRAARQLKIFVYNLSEDAVQLKNMDVSFRPAYLQSGVKGRSAILTPAQ
jgi:hypothetical protein